MLQKYTDPKDFNESPSQNQIVKPETVIWKEICRNTGFSLLNGMI
jgi:hypothetical protein